ncbi:conserved repeat domain [Roseiflexus castenholzii DSM 13941]|uniref:Conserved repeat domain n=1 Tax=Roseiflexus castenholzii (strain DSM 13941 / HLO8) TaxID=383372 RepID=A7NJ39_ROSCS|nr:conserved repeat domain [Roseiflexus castenholzii DSM 13941]
MPSSHTPSPEHKRRRAHLIALLLVPLILAPLIVMPQGTEAQTWDPPWPVESGWSTRSPQQQGWTKADSIGGGCRQNGRRTDCSSYIAGSPEDLYELVSRRQPRGACESLGCGPAEPGDAPVVVSRDQCTVDGVFLRWPRGIWHYGARFASRDESRTVTLYREDGTPYRVLQSRTIWRGPMGEHRAFWHNDSCEPPAGWSPQTPTLPGGGVPTSPPGTGTGTTPTPPPPTETPPPETPTETPGQCIPNPQHAPPIMLFEDNRRYTEPPPAPEYQKLPNAWVGAGNLAAYYDPTPNDEYMPFDSYRRHTPEDSSPTHPVTGIYKWGEPWNGVLRQERAYGNQGQYLGYVSNIYTQVIRQMPDASLWQRVRAGHRVMVRFDPLDTAFSPPGKLIGSNAYSDNPLTRKRRLIYALQDLGPNMRPEGGDDVLLAWLVLDDAPDPFVAQWPPQRMRTQTRWFGYAGYYPNTRSPVPSDVLGVNAGFLDDDREWNLQAYRKQDAQHYINVLAGRVFTYAGRDSVRPAPWPYLGAQGGSTYENHSALWLWPPPYEGLSDINFYFVPQPNRVYRAFAVSVAPICDEEYYTGSMLVFTTGGDADIALSKSAPEEAVREQGMGYALTARNIGSEAAQNVVIEDALPEGVTFVSADPPPSEVSGRTLRWNLGAVPAGEARDIQINVNINADAPDTLTNVATATATNDVNAANNRAEATTRLVRTNVGVRITATRLARPGDSLSVTIDYFNDSDREARNVTLTYRPPWGAHLVSLSRAESSRAGDGTLMWTFETLSAGASGRITAQLRAFREDEAAALPAMLLHRAVISTSQDANPLDNQAEAATALLVMPRPGGEHRLRIHSEFDRRQGVYRTETANFTWPSGETLFFTPEILLREPPLPAPPVYYARQRIVAWSFTGSGGLNLTSGSGCRAREQPQAAETEHADLSRMRGCVYRYYSETPGATTMRGQGRLYWSAFAPSSLAEATYGLWPLPDGGVTDLRIQYAVLVELVETGAYDLDGDGRGDSVLDRATFVQDATYRVTLVVPRDVR